MPEILTDGVDGLLAEPGDLESYLGHLEKIFHARPFADGLAAVARETVRRRFSVTRVREEFERVLQDIA